jgi:hypothetical protein
MEAGYLGKNGNIGKLAFLVNSHAGFKITKGGNLAVIKR